MGAAQLYLWLYPYPHSRWGLLNHCVLYCLYLLPAFFIGYFQLTDFRWLICNRNLTASFSLLLLLRLCLFSMKMQRFFVFYLSHLFSRLSCLYCLLDRLEDVLNCRVSRKLWDTRESQCHFSRSFSTHSSTQTPPNCQQPSNLQRFHSGYCGASTDERGIKYIAAWSSTTQHN